MERLKNLRSKRVHTLYRKNPGGSLQRAFRPEDSSSSPGEGRNHSRSGLDSSEIERENS
ncbi:MAG: hypothetical protein MJY46_06095 [Bacteroidales bacterium]|nr:hypothetical protein [Bacteroidales bacterium]